MVMSPVYAPWYTPELMGYPASVPLGFTTPSMSYWTESVPALFLVECVSTRPDTAYVIFLIAGSAVGSSG